LRRGAVLTLSVVLLGGTAARAQTYDPHYPVCLHTYGPVGYIDCRYRSLEQCRFNAVGRSAACEVNPYFRPTGPAPRIRRGRPS
jgi:hypothetical protein